jgi:hypothetical protein
MLNKGTGFPDSERDARGIRGMVPHQVVSIDDQASRAVENYYRQDNDLTEAIGRVRPTVLIGVSVCEVAFEQGLAGIERPGDLESHVRANMFQPSYRPYAPA